MTTTASYGDVILGKINNTDLIPDTFPSKFDLDAVAIINFLLVLAKEKNIDLGPLLDLSNVILQNPNQETQVNYPKFPSDDYI